MPTSAPPGTAGWPPWNRAAIDAVRRRVRVVPRPDERTSDADHDLRPADGVPLGRAFDRGAGPRAAPYRSRPRGRRAHEAGVPRSSDRDRGSRALDEVAARGARLVAVVVQ